MTTLDEEFSAGLKACGARNLATSHTAFAYLADRLVEIGIIGIDPEGEPTPTQLARDGDQVRKAEVRTVDAESPHPRDRRNRGPEDRRQGGRPRPDRGRVVGLGRARLPRASCARTSPPCAPALPADEPGA